MAKQQDTGQQKPDHFKQAGRIDGPEKGANSQVRMPELALLSRLAVRNRSFSAEMPTGKYLGKRLQRTFLEGGIG